eukprot:239168_1
MGAEQSKRIEEISSKPPAHLEEANKLFLSFYGDAIEKMTQSDWYEKIRMQMVLHLQDNNTYLNELLRILINTRPVRWAKWAMCLTARKKMMESVATTADSLVWSPFILDSQCCADALNLVDMNDSYLFLLAMTKTGSNKTTSSSTPDHQVARIEFKSFIISKLLSLTSAQDNFRTSSSILTTKLYQAKWKPLNNMQYIESLMDDLEDCGAVKLTDPEDKKKKNRKYCKIITRNKLSSLDDAQIAKAKKLFTKLDVPIRRWSCQWGSNEIATAAQKFK